MLMIYDVEFSDNTRANVAAHTDSVTQAAELIERHFGKTIVSIRNTGPVFVLAGVPMQVQ